MGEESMGGEGALGGVEGTVAALLASVPGRNCVIRGKCNEETHAELPPGLLSSSQNQSFLVYAICNSHTVH